MEAMSSSSSSSVEPATYDDFFLQQSVLFSDSLKDLKQLRTQLYSAAEYFEASYANDAKKETVVNTLKDYTVRALVNTVDHLGSITYKVTDLVDEKVDEVSGTELTVSCVEQRLRTCQACINREGFSQQSFVMTFPKYHKRYILPGRESKHGSKHIRSDYNECSLDYEDDLNRLKSAAWTTIRGSKSSSMRKGRSPSPAPRRSLWPETFSFRDKQKGERAFSPLRSKFPLLRSGSVSSRQTTPNCSRPTTPNPSDTRPRYPSELQKSFSMRPRVEGDNPRDLEQFPSKSKGLLRALLSRGKSKKDNTLYTFLDEY